MPQRDLLPLEMIGLLSGDPMIGKAVTAGRSPKGGARKSIGQGWFYDPVTDELKRDPDFASWEESRYQRDLTREEEKYQRGLGKPDYFPVETQEGVTVYDVNPRNRPAAETGGPAAETGGPAAETGGPYRIPMDAERPAPKEAAEAFKFERTSEDMRKLKENLPEGVGDLSDEFWLSAAETVAPEAMEPVVRNFMLDQLYSKEEQNSIRELSRSFATTVRQFAGAAQTKSEKANVQKFAPHPGMTHEQLLDSIDGFIEYLDMEAAAIRDPYGRTAPTRAAPAPTAPAPMPNVSTQSDDTLQKRLDELRQSQGGL